MSDFEYRGFYVYVRRKTLDNYLRRSYSFFTAYNPSKDQVLKGQGGKRKAKEAIDKLF